MIVAGRLTAKDAGEFHCMCGYTLTHNQRKGYLLDQANSHKAGSKAHLLNQANSHKAGSKVYLFNQANSHKAGSKVYLFNQANSHKTGSKVYLFNQANSDKAGSKRHEVPLDDLRLVPEGVSPAGEVSGVGGEVGVEPFDEPKGTVVNCVAQHAHVVRVEHAVGEADCLPFGN